MKWAGQHKLKERCFVKPCHVLCKREPLDREGGSHYTSGNYIVYSGRDDDDGEHTEGVAIMMVKVSTKSQILFQIYKDDCYLVLCTINDTKEMVNYSFYQQLQKEIDRTPKHDLLMVI